MTDVTVCKLRKNNPRIPLEVCAFHIQEKDPVCLTRTTLGKKYYVCEVTKKVKGGRKWK